jgi:hypothetical protein
MAEGLYTMAALAHSPLSSHLQTEASVREKHPDYLLSPDHLDTDDDSDNDN